MVRSETLARDHLVFRGFAAPVYEPDSNVPPDFLLDGRIAVEVRRLNENERGTLSPKGLEEREIPLLMGMQHLTKSFGLAGEAAWWLALRFRGPFPPWGTLAPDARAFLETLHKREWHRGEPHEPEHERPELLSLVLATAAEQGETRAVIARALHWKHSTFAEVVGVEGPEPVEIPSVVQLDDYRERKVM